MKTSENIWEPLRSSNIILRAFWVVKVGFIWMPNQCHLALAFGWIGFLPIWEKIFWPYKASLTLTQMTTFFMVLTKCQNKKFGFCPNRLEHTPPPRILRQNPVFFRPTPWTGPLTSILQKTAFSLVKSRLVLGLVGSLFICLFVRHHVNHGQIHRTVITSIGDTLVQTRKGEYFCRDVTGSCFTIALLVSSGASHRPM